MDNIERKLRQSVTADREDAFVVNQQLEESEKLLRIYLASKKE